MIEHLDFEERKLTRGPNKARLVEVPYEGDAIGLLRSDVLSRVFGAMKASDLHAVAFVRKDEASSNIERLRGLASYSFGAEIRNHNSGIHIDAIDRPESDDQIGVALFSPQENSSNAATWTIDTVESDKFFRFFFEQGEGKNLIKLYPEASKRMHEKIFEVFRRMGKPCEHDELGFWTLFHNAFMACIAAKPLRDSAVREIITRGKSVCSFLPKRGEESLMVMRNSIRDGLVSHARFNLTDGEAASEGRMLSFVVEEGGRMRPNRVNGPVPDGILVNRGGLTNENRASVIP